MTTYYEPLERNRWWDDGDAYATTKREDEIVRWAHDWSDALQTSETVSSCAYDDDGVTRTNTSLASNVSSADVTGIGEFEVTATLSTGRKLQRVVRFYAQDGTRKTDYA